MSKGMHKRNPSLKNPVSWEVLMNSMHAEFLIFFLHPEAWYSFRETSIYFFANLQGCQLNWDWDPWGGGAVCKHLSTSYMPCLGSQLPRITIPSLGPQVWARMLLMSETHVVRLDLNGKAKGTRSLFSSWDWLFPFQQGGCYLAWKEEPLSCLAVCQSIVAPEWPREDTLPRRGFKTLSLSPGRCFYTFSPLIWSYSWILKA